MDGAVSRVTEAARSGSSLGQQFMSAWSKPNARTLEINTMLANGAIQQIPLRAHLTTGARETDRHLATLPTHGRAYTTRN
jgi:hypothetical protein